MFKHHFPLFHEPHLLAVCLQSRGSFSLEGGRARPLFLAKPHTPLLFSYSSKLGGCPPGRRIGIWYLVVQSGCLGRPSPPNPFPVWSQSPGRRHHLQWHSLMSMQAYDTLAVVSDHLLRGRLWSPGVQWLCHSGGALYTVALPLSLGCVFGLGWQ